MDDVIISVKNLSKCYLVGDSRPGFSGWKASWRRWRSTNDDLALDSRFWALKEVSFDLRRGERLGIIGRNGAGKSTLLKIISRLVYPTGGEARLRGRVTALLEVGTGMNETLTGRENIFLNASLHGLSKDEIEARYDEIVAFSGLGQFIEEPIKSYSSGMRSRLGFAVAAHLEPDILILDEVLSVGDMAFAQKCLQKVEDLTSGGRTVIFVSHSMGDIVRFCDRALWLEQGSVVMHGEVKAVAEAYTTSVLTLKAEAASSTRERIPATGPDAAPARPEAPAAAILNLRLLDVAGVAKTVFLRNESIRVEVQIRALRSDLPVIVSVHIHKDGVHVLSTHPTSTMAVQQGSLYNAVVEVPPLLLNKGVFHFSAAVVTPVRPILRHSQLDLAVSCAVYDQLMENDIFSGEYRGVVRPTLPWKVTPSHD